MPFITAGDPDLETTAALLREAAARGAALVELGLPYSDPVADGPTIQASYTRALAGGAQLDDVFAMVERVRADCPLPIAAMGSFTLVTRRGLQRFLDDAQRCGIDGLIVPDLPLEEYADLARAAEQRDLAHILLAAPTTPWERAERIAERSTGFLYYVSVTGITGERDRLPPELADRVRRLREVASVPVCVGFGISTPDHVRAVAEVADGVIVGSAIVRRIGEMAGRPREAIVQAIGAYIAELVAALPR
jgi:tryptophan synthase alpha chain